MSTRELVAFGLQAALPVISAGIAYLMAQLTRAAVKYIHSKTALVLLGTLAVHMDAAAADVDQRIVRDLKDPSKPGTWNEIAQKAAKDELLKLVRESAPTIIEELKASDSLLGQLAEKSVSDIRAKSIPPPPLVTVAPAAQAPAPSLVPETVST